MHYILHDEINSNDIKILRREKSAGGRSDALDHGAEIADGEFVIMLDSDLKIPAEPWMTCVSSCRT